MTTASRRLLVLVAFAAPGILFAEPPDPVAVRQALADSRECLAKGDAARAVELLEKQLGKVRGDPEYLAALKQAYGAYLKDLQLGNKFEAFELYRKRLAVLEKNVPVRAVTPERREIVRGARPDDDPFQQTPVGESADPLALARTAFAEKNFAAARQAFDRARAEGVAIPADLTSQYAYCLLSDSVQRLNTGGFNKAGVERDVRAALALAANDPKMSAFARQVLAEVQQRPEAPATPPRPPAAVRHSDAGQGWKRAESQNFRLTHTQEPAYAEQLLQAAEQQRAAAFAKWGAAFSGPWQPVCEVVLHPDAATYAKVTKQSTSSPGHASIRTVNGKVVSRRLDLRADNPDLGSVTLPHEVTHVVLGDLFADTTLPRWADEGMAVLAEPRSQVDRYLKTMVRLRREGKLVPLAQILTKPEYPDAASVTVFYVESVSVVEFLVNQKGPASFAAFVRDSADGLDAALQKHYGLRDVATLQDHWLRATFTEIDRLESASR
jgi:tetratricopeptide (TPR) repeat protein